MSNRKVAIFLALFGGFIGLQKYFLKKIPQGVLFSIFSVTMIPFLLSLLDVIKFAMLNDDEFDDKYMGERIKTSPKTIARQPRRSYKEQRSRAPKTNKTTEKLNEIMSKGKRAYKSGKYREAAEIFKEGLKLSEKDIALNFNLACCYTQIEDFYAAYVHLGQAINANPDVEMKAANHPDLEALREHEHWKTFVNDGFTVQEKDFPFRRESLLDQMVDASNKRKDSSVLIEQQTKNNSTDNDYSEIFD